MVFRMFSDNRRAYAVHRAALALDRFIAGATLEQKRQAARWASAWYAAGRKYRYQSNCA